MRIVRHPATLTGKHRFILPLRVYYEDTDAAGVIYYANYLRFCERARTELLREVGFEQQALMSERGIAFVVRSIEADYLSPGLLDDALQVASTIETLRGASLVFAQQVTRGETVLFDARIVVACLDMKKNRSAPVPADLRAKLEKFVRT